MWLRFCNNFAKLILHISSEVITLHSADTDGNTLSHVNPFCNFTLIRVSMCSLKLFGICSVATVVSCGSILSSDWGQPVLLQSVVTLFRRALITPPSIAITIAPASTGLHLLIHAWLILIGNFHSYHVKTQKRNTLPLWGQKSVKCQGLSKQLVTAGSGSNWHCSDSYLIFHHRHVGSDF